MGYKAWGGINSNQPYVVAGAKCRELSLLERKKWAICFRMNPNNPHPSNSDIRQNPSDAKVIQGAG